MRERTHEARCTRCGVHTEGDVLEVARWVAEHSGSLFIEGSVRLVAAGCTLVTLQGQNGHDITVSRIGVAPKPAGRNLTR